MNRFLLYILVASLLFAWPIPVGRVYAAGDLASLSDFEVVQQVRGILSDKCFKCHGPNDESRQADLRLDRLAELIEKGDGQSIISPKDLDASELWKRVSSSDPKEAMPPQDSPKRLTEVDRQLIQEWILRGAPWSEHWSYTPPVRTAPPVTGDVTCANQIDAFVLNRLKREGLSPSPETNRATLIRRLFLDLTGLPPSLEDIARWSQTADADWYQRLVDELLASPHCGERWGRLWLDSARYADSDGFEKDKPRSVWFYRDWVVEALNRDLPYDDFVVQQLAGDLLPDADQSTRVATGFLRNSMINEEGGVDPEQFRMEAMFDRLDAIGKSILGLTVQCSQCHDHKFDPITQEDYYRLFAFFNNSHEANITVFTAEERQLREELRTRIARIEMDLKLERPKWRDELAAWASTLRERQVQWQPLRLEWNDNSLGGQKMLPQPDGSFLAQSYAPTKSEPWGSCVSNLHSVTAVRLDLLTDSNLPRGGPGRSIFGTAALSEIKVFAAPANEPNKKTQIKIVSASASLNTAEQEIPAIYADKTKSRRLTGPVRMAFDGDENTAWGTDRDPARRNTSSNAVFVFEKPVTFESGAIFTVHLSQKHGGWNSDDNQTHNLGRFRVSVTESPEPQADPLPLQVRELFEGEPFGQWSESDWAMAFSTWRQTLTEFNEANAAIEALWQQFPEGSTQLVLEERDRERPTHLLSRGDFLKPTKLVQRGVPAFLVSSKTKSTGAHQSQPANRLEFAQWLMDAQHPTPPRSIANRVWQAFFGSGLVRTAEDLGSQGALPTHPELLDWLTLELIEHGWKIKHLQRVIVLSATYRQSSTVTADQLERDPDNRLLARFPRIRLDAESIRDVTLAAAGLLDRRLGGPPVYPPAPEFLFEPPVSYGPKTWNTATGAGRYRRSLYTFRFRSVPYPPLQVFDAPTGDAACVVRSSSNTPLQALTSLNETLFVEAAQSLGRQALLHAGSDAERLNGLCLLTISRSPTSGEQAVLEKLLADARSEFAIPESVERAALVAGVENKSLAAIPLGNDVGEAAVWTSLARVVLNLDELINKE